MPFNQICVYILVWIFVRRGVLCSFFRTYSLIFVAFFTPRFSHISPDLLQVSALFWNIESCFEWTCASLPYTSRPVIRIVCDWHLCQWNRWAFHLLIYALIILYRDGTWRAWQDSPVQDSEKLHPKVMPPILLFWLMNWILVLW